MSKVRRVVALVRSILGCESKRIGVVMMLWGGGDVVVEERLSEYRGGVVVKIYRSWTYLRAGVSLHRVDGEGPVRGRGQKL